MTLGIYAKFTKGTLNLGFTTLGISAKGTLNLNNGVQNSKPHSKNEHSTT